MTIERESQIWTCDQKRVHVKQVLKHQRNATQAKKRFYSKGCIVSKIESLAILLP